MRTLDIYFKDVHAVIEHNRDDLERLKLFLDNCTIEYDPAKDPGLKVASDYVTGKFYPELEKLLTTLNGTQE